MTLVKINRSTFRKNPTAGNMTSTFDTGLTESRGYYEDDNGKYELVAVSADRLLVTHMEYTGMPTFNGGAEYPLSAFDLSRLKIETTRHVQTVHHMPEPDWLFDYEPTLVTCNECGATFAHSELTSDTHWSEGDESCSFSVCPKCGEWECCDVEYEDPNGVAKELGL